MATDQHSLIETVASVFTAIGTVTVAILAIWGDQIRAWVAGPRVELSLRDPRGALIDRANGKKTIYYHLSVANNGHWTPARSVRVLVVGLARRAPDGSYFAEPVIAPLQLTWAYPEFNELLPTVVEAEACDLGYVDEGADQFTLSTYIRPNNFRGSVKANEAVRVRVLASGHNFRSKPLTIEVSWDGKWSADLDDMRRHLVIKEPDRPPD